MKLLCAVCLLALLPASAAAEAPPHTVSTGSGDIARFPQAAVNDSGLSLVGWTASERRGGEPSETFAVYFAVSRGAQRLSRPVRVAGRGAGLLDVKAAPDGSFALLYAVSCGDRCTAPYRLRVVSRRGRLGRAERVDGVLGGSDLTLGVGRNGDFEVAYLTRGRRPAIIRRLGTRRFTRAHKLTDRPVGDLRFATNYRGAGIVGWAVRKPGVSGTAQWRTRPADGRWRPVQSGPEGFVAEPAVAVGANGHSAFYARVVVWPQTLPGFVARMEPDGALAGRDRLDGSVDARLAVSPAGDVVAKWAQPPVSSRSTDSRSLVAVLTSEGWSRQQVIGGSVVDFPVGFDRDGRGYALAVGNEALPTLWSRPPGGEFRPERQLSAAPGVWGDLDVNPRGVVVATWAAGLADTEIVATVR